MPEIKSIIVFGATGNTGLQTLERGIAEGLEVTAFVRTPSKIPPNIKSKLHRVIKGDALDRESVENAIKGHDAVLSALGTGWSMGETTVISEGCKNIISGMKKHNVRKLLVVSVAFLLPGRTTIFFLKKVTEDHARQIEILEKESESIDWIALMAPSIRNSLHIDPNYTVEINSTKTKGTAITTAELGDFMVKVFMDKASAERYNHCQVGIYSRPIITQTWAFKIGMISTLVALAAMFYYKPWCTM